jgi:putative ATP-binding cassette transporter
MLPHPLAGARQTIARVAHIVRESGVPAGPLLAVLVLAALSNALILAAINTAAEQVAKSAPGYRTLLLFALAAVLYWLTQRYVLVRATSGIESLLHRVRVRLMDKIRAADLMPFEGIGRQTLYASLNKDTVTISQAGGLLVVALQSVLLLAFAGLYILWLDRLAFLLLVAVFALAGFVYLRRSARVNASLHTAAERENDLFDAFVHLLDGFKEVQMSRARGDDLHARITSLSASATGLKSDTQAALADLFVLSQVIWYLLLEAIVFLVPAMKEVDPAVVVKLTTAVLFIIGPVTSLTSTLSVATNARVAIENLARTERQLDEAIRPTPPARELPETFSEIALRGVRFQFADPRQGEPFTVGPLDLTLRAGELVFITGGNGSGKSTLLRLLTALYRPQEGVIALDGLAVEDAAGQAYRDLFSAVFSDAHLFRKLYGIRDASPERIAGLLELLELDGKTGVVDGRFTHLDLSAGQRKRVALLVSLLEDRPIHVFDEWAAEQDPEFRARFYREILPRLRESGKTVVVVTHDDRYFDVADRTLKMEYGRFVEAGA